MEQGFPINPGFPALPKNLAAVLKQKPKGLTLVELLVVLSLLGLLSAFVYNFLIQLIHLNAQASRRGKLQAEMTVSLNSLSSDLEQSQASCIARADLVSGGVATGFVRLKDMTGLGTRVFEDKFIFYGWEPAQGKLVRKVFPSGGSFPSIGSAPPLLSGANLASMMSWAPNPGDRNLSDCVKNFGISVVAGPAVDLQLELQLDGNRVENLRVNTTLALRN